MARIQNSAFSKYKDTLAKSAHLMDEIRKTGVNFLKTEVAMGLSFAKSAMESKEGSDKRSRNTAHARKAYDTISRQGGSKAIQIDLQELEPKLTELKKALGQLGQRV